MSRCEKPWLSRLPSWTCSLGAGSNRANPPFWASSTFQDSDQTVVAKHNSQRGEPLRELTCPSHICASGNLLIGIVNSDGNVVPLRNPLEVDDDFVRRASAASHQSPESRFRFAGPCVTTSCKQWTGSRCAIGDVVAAAWQEDSGALQPCSIRATCRWWAQNGPSACSSCLLVVRTPHGAIEAGQTSGHL